MSTGGVSCALRLIVSVTVDKLDSCNNPRALPHIWERSQLPSGGTHKTEGGLLEFLKVSASSIRVTLFIYSHLFVHWVSSVFLHHTHEKPQGLINEYLVTGKKLEVRLTSMEV